MEEYVNTVLRPLVRGDGGEVEYVSLDGQALTLRFRGECSKCAVLDRCIAWCEEKIFLDLGRRVNIVPVRLKPYFWDN